MPDILLETAENHVTEAERAVARQMALIANLDNAATLSRHRLCLFETMLGLHRENLERLRRGC